MQKFSIIFILLFINFKVIANEVKILNEILGHGNKAVNHSKVSVHYIGKLEDGTEFDNSYKRKKFFQFQIGTRQVIPGWETGLLGMREGGKRTIYIPYQLAYGDNGAGELIPPKSNLIFEIELVTSVSPKYREIDSFQLKLAISDENFTIIDIRSPEEIKLTGQIPNSIILTAFNKNGSFHENFLNKYQELIDPNSKVIFVSDKGIISSILANGFVEQLNQTNIYNLKDGIQGLKKINFEFKKN